MGELALLQRDGDREAKEGDTDEWSDFKMAEDVERMTQAVEDECPVALKVGSVRHGVGDLLLCRSFGPSGPAMCPSPFGICLFRLTWCV